MIEVHGEKEIRVERLPSDQARLERRLKDFFVHIVPDQVLEGPKILRGTACSDLTSQEARVNEMLRNMKIQDRIATGLDLTTALRRARKGLQEGGSVILIYEEGPPGPEGPEGPEGPDC